MITTEDISIQIIRLLRKYTGISYIVGGETDQTKLFVTSEDNQSQEQLEAISVLVELNTSQMEGAGYFTAKTYQVDISYIAVEIPTQKAITKMLEKIDTIMKPFFKVKDRAMSIYDAAMNITDDIGHYIFTLQVMDTTNYNPNAGIPLAAELKFNYKEE